MLTDAYAAKARQMTDLERIICRMISAILIMIAIGGAPGVARGQSPALAFDHVTVIDGTGAPPRQHMTVVLSDGRIKGLFPSGTRPLPAGAKVIDLTGRSIIPGLIDAHVHVATDPSGRDAKASEQLRSALMGGVTAVRDMAGDAVVLQKLAAAATRAGFESPRIYYAAVMAGPTFFEDPRTATSAHGGKAGEVAWMQAVTAETDIAKAVSRAKLTGATGVKIYADVSPRLVARIAREVHRQGMKVWTHATIYPSRPSDAVDAGADVISHALLLYWEGAKDVPTRYHRRVASAVYDSLDVRGSVVESMLRDMKAHNTVLDATLFISSRLESAPAGTAGMTDPRRALEWMYRVTRRAKEMGVTVAAGTDGMSPGGAVEPPNIHREMELLVSRAGFSPIEAISAATRNSARAIGIEGNAGTVAVGKDADLVVLTADPSSNIRNTREIELVVKRGIVFERKAFVASVEARRQGMRAVTDTR